jgi:hypothetical protein
LVIAKSHLSSIVYVLRKSQTDVVLRYISQLTPDYIAALAETVSDLQVDALRDAVAKHLSFSTSIRVHMPVRCLPWYMALLILHYLQFATDSSHVNQFGYRTFRLEFHLPYLELRQLDDCTIDAVTPIHHRPATVLSDLSFLNLESTEEGTSHYCLQKSHVSIVICGSDNLQWVGYAFKNSADDIDEEEDESDVNETDGDEDTYEDGDEDGDMDQDPDEDEDEDENEGGGDYQADLFASEDSYRVLDANIPTCDAREYWLCVVDLRLRLIVDKWEYVVHKVEQSVKNQVGC